MTGPRRILGDSRGSSAIEFSIAVPILVTLLWGMFQVAILYQANAGMHHALGEAARYATVYLPTTNAPPTDAQIQAKITSAKFGLGTGTWGTPTIVTNTTTRTKLITVTYTQPMDFLFFPGPNVNLNASKLVYLAT